MKTKIYIYGLCDVFYDGYYIQGLKELYTDVQFNVSKFPKFNQGTFAFIIESQNQLTKIIIDSVDSPKIKETELDWCDIYGKVNYNLSNLPAKNQDKIVAIGPSFGIKIWNFTETLYHVTANFVRFRKSVSNKREFIANYWRQYKRLSLKNYNLSKSSEDEVFFINSIWKQEKETNQNRALFIEACKSNPKIKFEGGFAARSNGDNLGFDHLVYSKKIPLKVYIQKIKNSAIAFNTPAVLSCHGWKLAEFLALGKAIITTPHYNILPADLQNEINVLYAENGAQIAEMINKLINNPELKDTLEHQNRAYFDQYLAPQSVITRLIQYK